MALSIKEKARLLKIAQADGRNNFQEVIKTVNTGSNVYIIIANYIVNTGIFLIACALVYMPLITSWANASEFGSNIAGYFIYGLVGANFVVEMLINSALATTSVRVIKVAKK